MTRLYDTTIGQFDQFKRLLAETGNLTAEDVDAVLKQPKLAKGMVDWLREQLNPPIRLPEGLLTPVGELVDRFMARSELRKWGFTSKDADKLHHQLAGHNHAGVLMPVGVSTWLGKNLRYNWSEALAWMFDTARELGLSPQDYIGDATLEFYQDSEIRGRRKLEAVGLDFMTFRDRQAGIVPRDVRATHQGRRWPSLEVPYFLALNPGYMKAMDGGDIPFLIASGLVVRSAYVPYFDRFERKFYAGDDWADNRWYDTAMVDFRELQH